jgi:hypothetical protein
MGTSVRQLIDFGGDGAYDSSQVELLRLQPMLPKSLGVAGIAFAGSYCLGSASD